MRGCAAIARTGRISSHSVGIPTAAGGSGIERQSFAHSRRAFCSSERSLRSRACNCAICSLTVLSITGLTCAGTATFAPAMVRLLSPIETCAVSLGSMRHSRRTSGREVIATLPWMAALAFNCLIFTLPSCLAALLPSTLPSTLPSGGAACCGQRAEHRQLAVERCRQRQRILHAACGNRPARHRPVDVGVLKDLADGIVRLAADIVRRGAIEPVAQRGDRDGNRRQDFGIAARRAGAAATSPAQAFEPRPARTCSSHKDWRRTMRRAPPTRAG